MLRIAEHWHGSDLGRQRQGNEDNFFVRAPLFVVADGMGGAQAGEVASEMAVRVVRAGPRRRRAGRVARAGDRGGQPAASTTARAPTSSAPAWARRCTAAYVDEDDVVVAHVGDSRAYLWRGGDLIRLTKDHSLVGELVARGKLTEEQAEAHPQRSVITRALGPEPTSRSTSTSSPRAAGDVFLLCSDGLTSMVNEAKLKPILAAAGSLEQAGRALIAAANEAGGRDNITVILFRLEEVGAPAEAPAEERPRSSTPREYATFSGDALGGPRQGASRAVSPTSPTRSRPSTGAPARSRCRRSAPRAETETEGAAAAAAHRCRSRETRRSPSGAAGAGGGSRPGRSWR